MRKITLVIFQVICAFFYIEISLHVSYICWFLSWFQVSKYHWALFAVKHRAGYMQYSSQFQDLAAQ